MAARKTHGSSQRSRATLLQRHISSVIKWIIAVSWSQGNAHLTATNSTSPRHSLARPSSTGGRTPLASGLRLALRTFRCQDSDNQQTDNPGPVTDGRANVADATRGSALNPLKMPWLPLMSCVLQECPHWVIDTEEGVRMGLARYTGPGTRRAMSSLHNLKPHPLLMPCVMP